MFEPGTRVLAVLAHPDDAELTCFGTLARVIAEGGEAYVLVATKGHASGTDQTVERVGETFRASMLGDYLMIAGDLQDGAVAFNQQTVSLIDRYISELKPTVVITHYPQKNGTGHQDHDALAGAVVAAVRRCQTVKTLLYAEPPTQAWDFVPNLFVDVTDHFEAKRQAVAFHASEKGKAYMLLDALETRAKWWAFQAYVDGYEARRFEAFQLVKGTL